MAPILLQKCEGTFFNEPPMCDLGGTTLAYAAVFGMKDAFMLATEQSAANQLIKLDDREILPEVRPTRRARARMRATRPSAHAGCAREKSTSGL